MDLEQWTSLLACVGVLACAVLALRRASESPLALPLALLSLDLFAWNFASFAFSVSGLAAWRWLDVTASPWSPPLALFLAATFVGKRRAWRWPLWIAFTLFGALSCVGALAFFAPWARAVLAGSMWSALYLAALVPTMAAMLGLLVSHLRGAMTEAERGRTRLILLALGIGTSLGMTDLLAGSGLPIPRLANLGILIGNVLLLIVTLRFRLLKDALSSATAWAAGMVALLAVVAYVELFRWFAPTVALPLLAFATLSGVALSLAAPLGLAARRRAERLRRLAALGRVSDQLAHDLQNPLAALRGAAQYLREEAARGHLVAERLEFFDLIIAQADRMTATIDRYRRLGRVEPQLTTQDLNRLVQHTLALQPLADARVQMKLELAEETLEVAVDADLVAAALHNLAKNAVEAMPEGGTLTVRTDRAEGPREAGVRLTVEDTGAGMDARVRERAFEDFFTTKAGGTGLGLAFVRRVTEAHGGEVLLTSREGQGTRVQMFLPTSGLARS